MKALINLTQEEYDLLNEFRKRGYGVSRLEAAILDSIILPENTTNGKMMDAIFDRDTRRAHVVCSREWLNMPYKENCNESN